MLQKKRRQYKHWNSSLQSSPTRVGVNVYLGWRHPPSPLLQAENMIKNPELTLFFFFSNFTTHVVLIFFRDLRKRTMSDSLISIPKDDTLTYPFCRLQLVVETLVHSTYEPTNQDSIKVSKV